MILRLPYITTDQYYNALYEHSRADTSLASPFEANGEQACNSRETVNNRGIRLYNVQAPQPLLAHFLILVMVLVPSRPEELIKRPLATVTRVATASSTGSTLIALQYPSK